MKNIEKFQNTFDAVFEWDKYHAGGGNKSFEVWLEDEYVEPREPSLLEAANMTVKMWYTRGRDTNLGEVRRAMSALAKVAYNENQKQIRNCDRYATAEEATEGFSKMCKGRCCDECPFNAIHDDNYRCQIKWLYAEADKEATK